MGKCLPNDVRANLGKNEERAALVAVRKHAMYPNEPLEVRREVTSNLRSNVGAFNRWQVCGVPRPIPNLQMNREASEMACPAASVA